MFDRKNRVPLLLQYRRLLPERTDIEAIYDEDLGLNVVSGSQRPIPYVHTAAGTQSTKTFIRGKFPGED